MIRNRYIKLQRELDMALMAACRESTERGLELLSRTESKYRNKASRNTKIADLLLKYKWVLSAMAEDFSEALECIEKRLDHYDPDLITNHDLCVMIMDLINCTDHVCVSDRDKMRYLRSRIHRKIFYEKIASEPGIASLVGSLAKFENAGKSGVFRSIYRRACIFYSLDPGDDVSSNIKKMHRKYRKIARTPPNRK